MPNDITPGRTTTWSFDVPDYTLSQEPFWRDWNDLEIVGNTVQPQTTNVSFIKDIGWRLDSYQKLLQLTHEQGALKNQNFNGFNSQLPPNFLSVSGSTTGAAHKRWIQELSGVPQGTQVETGDYFNLKAVAAGDDWSSDAYSLSADYSSYPPPSELEIVPLDRVLISNETILPNQPLNVRFIVPGSTGVASLGALIRVYFTGIPGGFDYLSQVQKGTGQYALTLFGDGVAALWELSLAGTWAKRFSFNWAGAHAISGATHFLTIESDSYQDGNGNWRGSNVVFTNQNFTDVIGLALNVVSKGALGSQASSSTYQIPGIGLASLLNPPPQPALVPHRVDVRRDVRLHFVTSTTLYQPSGVLQTQTFDIPFRSAAVNGVNNSISVSAFGIIPTGCSVSIALYDSNGNAATLLSSTSSLTAANATFASMPNVMAYYAVATLNANPAGTMSPSIREVSVVRNCALSLIAPTSFTPAYVTEVSLVGASKDPTTECASLTLHDFESGLAMLTTRSAGMSCRCEINLPAPMMVNGVAASSSTLLVGKVNKARRIRVGATTGKLWPAADWGTYALDVAGHWSRLMQAKTAQTYSFAQDKDDLGPDNKPQPYKVSEVLNILISNAGYPSNMIDIPDDDIRFFPAPGQDQAYNLEVYTPVLPVLLEWISTYYGGYLVFDANASNGGSPTDKYGCWRVKRAPRPNASGFYTPLCDFVQEVSIGDGHIRSAFDLNSYPTVLAPDGTTMIPSCPIKRGTLKTWDEEPEGNEVYVCGIASGPGNSLTVSAGDMKLAAVIQNYVAAKFSDDQPIACDPTHPDFTDGTVRQIISVRPDLTTQGAVNFTACRIFDMACHRKYWVSFEAPAILVVDPADTLAVRPRPLRFGDPVVYRGGYWFVGSAVIDYAGARGGTRNSLTTYELFSIPQLNAVDAQGAYQAGQIYAGTCGETLY